MNTSGVNLGALGLEYLRESLFERGTVMLSTTLHFQFMDRTRMIVPAVWCELPPAVRAHGIARRPWAGY